MVSSPFSNSSCRLNLFFLIFFFALILFMIHSIYFSLKPILTNTSLKKTPTNLIITFDVIYVDPTHFFEKKKLLKFKRLDELSIYYLGSSIWDCPSKIGTYDFLIWALGQAHHYSYLGFIISLRSTKFA